MIFNLRHGTPIPPKFKKTEIILHFLLLICGWDLSAVDISGFNIRLTWLLLPALYLFTPRSYVPFKYAFFVYAFFIFHLLSTLVSGELFRGFIYSLWILFSYYFFFVIGFRCSHDLGDRVFKVILSNGRFQIVCATVLYLTGLQDRAHLFYYEPSYMAVALIPYVATVFFGGSNRLLDFILVLSFLIISQSGSYAFILLLAAVLKAYSLRRNENFIKVVFSFIVILICIFWYVYIDKDNINHRLIASILDTGINWESAWFIVERGGNRIPRMQVALDVLLQNFWFGIGSSNYISYIYNIDFSYITNGFEDIEPYGKPPTNILIEAGLNSGVFGLMLLIFFFGYFFAKSRKILVRETRIRLQSAIFLFFLMLQLDSNYLRAYVWVGFGVAYGFILRVPRVKLNES